MKRSLPFSQSVTARMLRVSMIHHAAQAANEAAYQRAARHAGFTFIVATALATVVFTAIIVM